MAIFIVDVTKTTFANRQEIIVRDQPNRTFAMIAFLKAANAQLPGKGWQAVDARLVTEHQAAESGALELDAWIDAQ